jgi:hypothetical protein
MIHHLGEEEDSVAKDNNDDWDKKPLSVFSPLPTPAIIDPLKNEIGMDFVIRIIDIILCRTVTKNDTVREMTHKE